MDREDLATSAKIEMTSRRWGLRVLRRTAVFRGGASLDGNAIRRVRFVWRV